MYLKVVCFWTFTESEGFHKQNTDLGVYIMRDYTDTTPAIVRVN